MSRKLNVKILQLFFNTYTSRFLFFFTELYRWYAIHQEIQQNMRKHPS